jgi:hypothetical protein
MYKKISLLVFITTFSFLTKAQDNIQKANALQQKYKDFEAYIDYSSGKYTFKANAAEKKVEVKEEKSQEILSLRYNTTINEIEVYDQNSSILKFYGESSLRQKAINEFKFCGQYTQEGYFYDDSKFCSHTLKLKEIGELWSLKSIKEIKDARYFTSVYFESSYPVREKKITFVIPGDVEVELVEFNFEGYSITKNKIQQGKDQVVEYVAKDLNGTLNERYSRGAQYFRPHILVLVKSINTSKGKVSILSSAADLYSWYHSLILQLAPNPAVMKPMVESLIKDKKTDEEKIQAIYYWVQDNIRYIAFENGIAGFKPDDAQNVFEKKYGDCKGMANLLKEMMKLAGFDARLTWVGTKQIRYDYSIPSLAVDNHMICTVLIGDKKYFLDATEKYNPLGENAERIQGREVLIENGESYIIQKVPEDDKARDLELKKFSLSITGEKMEGNCELILNGETRKNFLHGYHYTKTEEKTRYIENQLSEGSTSISLSNLKLPDLTNREKTISITSTASLNNFVSKFNNEMYIEADPTKEFKGWELKEKRQSDLDFGKKINTRMEVVIELPSEYKLSSVPDNLSVSEEEFSFKIGYKVEGNKVIYTKEIAIDKGIISRKSFKVWNESLKKLNTVYSSPIVIKK